MKYWPVPESYTREIPVDGIQGSFWKDRGDRRHCGVDIYAPEGSDVLSIERGVVLEVGIFSTKKKNPYWNRTYYVIIKNESKILCKYAELGEVIVKPNDKVSAGQLIGKVGLILNSAKITEESPHYIQDLKNKPSMLHFELWEKKVIQNDRNYSGGNWFQEKKPKNLKNPTAYLRNLG